MQGLYLLPPWHPLANGYGQSTAMMLRKENKIEIKIEIYHTLNCSRIHIWWSCGRGRGATARRTGSLLTLANDENDWINNSRMSPEIRPWRSSVEYLWNFIFFLILYSTRVNSPVFITLHSPHPSPPAHLQPSPFYHRISNDNLTFRFQFKFVVHPVSPVSMSWVELSWTELNWVK